MKKLTLLVLGLALVVALASGCSDGNKNASGYEKIKTQTLKESIGKSGTVVVDARQSDVFNGWKLDGVERGGHIKGATDFAYTWVAIAKKDATALEAVKKAMADKGISSAQNVIVYDANGKDANAVADFLKENGVKDISVYDVKEWAKDASLEMESFPNYSLVVSPQWIKDVMDGRNPETFKGGKYKLFEVSWGDESTSYAKDGHIPGSVHINTDEIEFPPLWSIKSDKELEQFVLNNGIKHDDTVILSGMDPMASYRIQAILKYIGVNDVRVLNGGLQAWISQGYDIEKASHPKVKIDSFGIAVPANKGLIIDINEAKKILADKAGSQLVDIRSWDEHTGKITGYSDLKFKGRPAGAIWGEAGTDPNHLEAYRNVDNTMRNGNEILAMWAKDGIDVNKRLSFFCGSGWRAAEVLMFSEVLGVKNASLYSNGWYEWSFDKNNPVELGEPKKQ